MARRAQVKGGSPLTIESAIRKYDLSANEVAMAGTISCGAAVFQSGAQSSEKKPRYDLIPVEALRREAVRMAEGAAAHGVNNYRKGAGDEAFRLDRLNHAWEHLAKYIHGDRSEDHLAAVRCNMGIVMWLDSHWPAER